ncbi:hypothetical protein FACS1894142_5910 [Spirochaetia bacterium]|nr:hypothetical protein FACS1894142_5910 [Spirochaetia bacterium]
MEYAVALYFDKTIEEKINSLILKIANDCGNKYMVDNKIPPHITISLFQYDDIIAPIIKIIDENISWFKKGNISLVSIGIFNPNVLFIMPIVNNFLIKANRKITKLLESDKKINMDKNYIQNQWVPHISLAVKLNTDELINGIKTVINNYNAFGGEINRIVFSECNPYKEIKIWNL